ncbi:Outer spore coat protein E (CotE) [compost metagenome]
MEREFRVELVAETKVRIIVSPHDFDEADDKHLDFDAGDDGDFEDLDPELLDDDN